MINQKNAGYHLSLSVIEITRFIMSVGVGHFNWYLATILIIPLVNSLLKIVSDFIICYTYIFFNDDLTVRSNGVLL